MKKQLTTAMAAAMAFGTVVPAFAEVETPEYNAIKKQMVVDQRILEGEELLSDDKGDVIVFKRANIFNLNDTQYDRNDDLLMSKYSGYDYKVIQYEENPNNDLVILSKEDTNISATDVKVEKEKMDTIEGINNDYYGKYIVTKEDLAASINEKGKYEPGKTKYHVYAVENIKDKDDKVIVKGIKDRVRDINKKIEDIKDNKKEEEDYKKLLDEKKLLESILDNPLKKFAGELDNLDPVVTHIVKNIDKGPKEAPGTPSDVLADQLRSEVFGLEELERYTYDFDLNTLVTEVNGEKPVTNDVKKEVYRDFQRLLAVIEENHYKFDIYVDDKKADKFDGRITNGKVTIYRKGETELVPANLVLGFTVKNVELYDDDFLVEVPVISDFRDHWAHDIIKNAMELGQVEITDTFRPNDPVTRAEFAKMIATVYGGYRDDEARIDFDEGKLLESFDDVDVNTWYAPYVAYVQTKGIARGTEKDVKFSPHQPITRQESAIMVANIAEVSNGKKLTTPYKDIDIKNMHDAEGDTTLEVYERVLDSDLRDIHTADAWADHAIDAVYNARYVKDGESKYIMRGYSGFTFKPQNEITRAETLALLYQLVDHNEYQAGLLDK